MIIINVLKWKFAKFIAIVLDAYKYTCMYINIYANNRININAYIYIYAELLNCLIS